MEVSPKFPGNVRDKNLGISTKFQFPGNFRDKTLNIPTKFPGHFQEISGKFPKISGNIREFSRTCPGQFPEIARNFREISWTFTGRILEISGSFWKFSKFLDFFRKFPGRNLASHFREVVLRSRLWRCPQRGFRVWRFPPNFREMSGTKIWGFPRNFNFRETSGTKL